MHAKIENGTVAQYPYSVEQLIADNLDTSFPSVIPDERLADWGVYVVAPTAAPAFDSATQKLVESGPVKSSGVWLQSWNVVALTDQEQAAIKRAIQNEVVARTQERLDAFAQTRNYDGILSACTYAGSLVQKFAADGQYCVQARDATWSALYAMLSEVEAGTRPLPSGYDDIESDLPILAWPT